MVKFFLLTKLDLLKNVDWKSKFSSLFPRKFLKAAIDKYFRIHAHVLMPHSHRIASVSILEYLLHALQWKAALRGIRVLLDLTPKRGCLASCTFWNNRFHYSSVIAMRKLAEELMAHLTSPVSIMYFPVEVKDLQVLNATAAGSCRYCAAFSLLRTVHSNYAKEALSFFSLFFLV